MITWNNRLATFGIAVVMLMLLLEEGPSFASSPQSPRPDSTERLSDWSSEDDQAKQNYMIYCMGCHLADGAATPGKVPTFQQLPARIAAAPGGRDYLIRVPGNANSGLNAQESADVMNWIMVTFSNKADQDEIAIFTAAEVEASRATPMLDPAKVRRDIMVHLGESVSY